MLFFGSGGLRMSCWEVDVMGRLLSTSKGYIQIWYYGIKSRRDVFGSAIK